MSKFLGFTKCDYCGKWRFFAIKWVHNEQGDYCNQMCAEHKTIGFAREGSR